MTDATRLHIVLFEPEIPQNTGNVARTCVAVAAKLWLVRPLGFRIDDYYLRRAGLDYWQFLNWEVVDDWEMLMERLPESRRWFFSKTASRPYTDVAFHPGDVMVFGCESTGLPREMLDGNETAALRIPIRADVRSLNLSNAVAVVAYEALRQFAIPE